MIFELDAYSPHQIAEKVETIGVAKARLPPLPVTLGNIVGGAGLVAAVYFLIYRVALRED